MHLGIKDGGDGVPCWNRQAVTAHVDEVNRREQQVAERNPDVVVLPGRLVCYGCEVMEFDYGIKCTASLTRTRYVVDGEIEPRAEDAAGSLLERGLVEEAGRSQFGAVLYRTTALFLKLFGLKELGELPDVARWDPDPDQQAELRDRLLRAGEARSGAIEAGAA